MSEEFEKVLLRIALALGIGLLIGLERGWHTREARPGSRTAGVRTFAISGLLGGIVAALARGADERLSIAGGILIGTVFMAYAAVMTVFGRDENRATHGFSATTTVAALLTFMLGAYAQFGDVRVAAGAAIAAAGVLIIREELHDWVKRMTLAEFQSGLILLAMTFIALPILPDRPLELLGGINPREIWIIAILLASVSFGGYVAVRLLGERRGVLVASAVGGLVSSTAVILASARLAAAGEGSARVLAAGASVATAVSCVRVAVLATVLEPVLAPLLIPPLLAAVLAALAIAFVQVRRQDSARDSQSLVALRNPFRFFPVLGLAASIGILIVVGRLVHQLFGTGGALAGAALMGLFDVDPMTVSMTQLVPGSLTANEAAYAILAGVASNTLGKAALGALIGRGRFAIVLVVLSIACLLAAGLVLLVMRQT